MRLLSQRSISFAACKLVHTGESGWRVRRVKARGQVQAYLGWAPQYRDPSSLRLRFVFSVSCGMSASIWRNKQPWVW